MQYRGHSAGATCPRRASVEELVLRSRPDDRGHASIPHRTHRRQSPRHRLTQNSRKNYFARPLHLGMHSAHCFSYVPSVRTQRTDAPERRDSQVNRDSRGMSWTWGTHSPIPPIGSIARPSLVWLTSTCLGRLSCEWLQLMRSAHVRCHGHAINVLHKGYVLFNGYPILCPP